MSGFGNKFTAARESKNLKIEEIAHETRISARFLRAIEDEKFQALPGGLFNRGFIRTYANFLGIDPAESVAEYQALVNEATADESAPVSKIDLDAPEGHIMPIAVGSLIVLVVLFYVFARDPGMPTEAAAPLIAEVAEPASFTPVSQPPPEALAPAIESSPAGAPSPRITQSGFTDNATGIDVRIEVHNDTWVSVQSDGEAVVEGVILGAGTTRRYSASEALEITIGNAAGLTLSINGREVPTLGRDGQVRTLTITPNNIDRFTGS